MCGGNQSCRAANRDVRNRWEGSRPGHPWSAVHAGMLGTRSSELHLQPLGSGVRSLCQQRYYADDPSATVHANFSDSSGTRHHHRAHPHPLRGQCPDRFSGRRPGGEYIVHQHDVGIRAGSQGGRRWYSPDDPAIQIRPARRGTQTDRVAHLTTSREHRCEVAIGQPPGRHPRRPQHRITAATTGRHAPAGRGHEDEWTAGRAQSAYPPGQGEPQRSGQITATGLLHRQHRPARWAGVRTERPAGHSGIGTRPDPHRRRRERPGAPHAPTRPRRSASPAVLRQDQFQQHPHRASVTEGTDIERELGPRTAHTPPAGEHGTSRGSGQPGNTGTAFAPSPGTSRQNRSVDGPSDCSRITARESATYNVSGAALTTRTDGVRF